MRLTYSLVLAAALATLFAPDTTAASNSLTVPGTSDIWLAGQANGTILVGGFPSNDVAPANIPVLASAGLNMTAGSVLTFSVTGTTNFGGCASPSPDGAGACGNFSSGAFFGISPYTGPINALVGVFVGAGTPGGAAPAGLDFTTLASQSQATNSPLLNQVFFIGDGLTGTGSGSVQQFAIPAGAARLFIASSDGAGASYNNSASLSVTVSDAASAPSVPAAQGAPAATPFTLLLTGVLLTVAGGYLLNRRGAARFQKPAPNTEKLAQ